MWLLDGLPACRLRVEARMLKATRVEVNFDFIGIQEVELRELKGSSKVVMN